MTYAISLPLPELEPLTPDMLDETTVQLVPTAWSGTAAIDHDGPVWAMRPSEHWVFMLLDDSYSRIRIVEPDRDQRSWVCRLISTHHELVRIELEGENETRWVVVLDPTRGTGQVTRTTQPR
jgi:hypothetical protein